MDDKSIPAAAIATKNMFDKKLSKEEICSFSFMAPKTEVAKWRFFAKFTGIKLKDMGIAAFEEYLENHPLSKEQQKVFDTMLEEQILNK